VEVKENPKSEIRNKSQIMEKESKKQILLCLSPSAAEGQIRDFFHFHILEIRICFGSRISEFGFHSARGRPSDLR